MYYRDPEPPPKRPTPETIGQIKKLVASRDLIATDRNAFKSYECWIGATDHAKAVIDKLPVVRPDWHTPSPFGFETGRRQYPKLPHNYTYSVGDRNACDLRQVLGDNVFEARALLEGITYAEDMNAELGKRGTRQKKPHPRVNDETSERRR